MSLVSGTITFAPDIDTRPPIIVKAYDVDLISKQLLGQRTLGPFSASESFEITYTRRDFGADEGTGRADVKVEAISEDGLFAAESNIMLKSRPFLKMAYSLLNPTLFSTPQKRYGTCALCCVRSKTLCLNLSV